MKRTKLINLKVTESEYEQIHRAASRHYGGNVSEMLRKRGVVVGENILDDDEHSHMPDEQKK